MESLRHQQTDCTQSDNHRQIASLQRRAAHRAHNAGQRLGERSLLICQRIGQRQRDMFHVLARHAHIFREAARIEIGGLEGGAHRDIAMLAVVALAARNVMRDDDPLPRRERCSLPRQLDHHAR